MRNKVSMAGGMALALVAADMFGLRRALPEPEDYDAHIREWRDHIYDLEWAATQARWEAERPHREMQRARLRAGDRSKYMPKGY